MNALVLVENEVTAGGRFDHWEDVTGERYQFPNQYRTKIRSGRPFVYYKGSRRADGSRGVPEYFGCGTVGSVYPDPTNSFDGPKARRKWLCDVEDYRPFPVLVAARQGSKYLEDIPPNFWGVGVRDLPESVYNAILSRAGLPLENLEIPALHLNLPPLPEVEIKAANSLLVPHRPSPPNASAEASRGTWRRSKYSAAIGKRGEEIALAYLRQILSPTEAKTLRWTAAESETPGWDIEYRSGGNLVAIEVKSSAGPAFPFLEVSANEWNAARRLGATYRLVLVADVKTRSPRVQVVENPADLVDRGIVRLEPAVWRMALHGAG
jgi:hypothetical protein